MRLVDTAASLFRRFGYQAVGVDMIAEEADVAKMTLYRHFESKDALIDRFLGGEDERLRAWMYAETAECGSASAKIRAFFEALEERTTMEACEGCPFQMAVGEFPDPSHTAHQQARRHKAAIRQILIEWCRGCGFHQPEVPAHELYLLMEGAWTTARLRLDGSPAGELAEAAMMIVEGGLFAQAVTDYRRADSTKTDW